MSKNQSQNKRVLNWLRRNATITSLQAFKHFTITRLSARIYDLKKMGHKIENTRKSGYAEYKLYE